MFHFLRFLFHIAPFLILAYLWIHFDLGTVIGSWITHAGEKLTAFTRAPSSFSAPIFHR
jgi:hypothetical protein